MNIKDSTLKTQLNGAIKHNKNVVLITSNKKINGIRVMAKVKGKKELMAILVGALSEGVGKIYGTLSDSQVSKLSLKIIDDINNAVFQKTWSELLDELSQEYPQDMIDALHEDMKNNGKKLKDHLSADDCSFIKLICQFGPKKDDEI